MTPKRDSFCEIADFTEHLQHMIYNYQRMLADAPSIAAARRLKDWIEAIKTELKELERAA